MTIREKILVLALAFGLVWATPKAVYAALAVFDSSVLSATMKDFAESVKQTKEMIEQTGIFEAIQEIQEKIQEYTNVIMDAIGPPASIAIEVSEWASEGVDVSCLMPSMNLVMPSFEGTSLCEMQDTVRSELGMPTTRQLNSTFGAGTYAANEYMREIGDGEMVAMTPAEVAERREEVRGRREALAVDSAYDSIAVATNLLDEAEEGVEDVLESVGLGGAVTLQEKTAGTNKLLAEIRLEIQENNRLLAQLLLLQASERLRREPLEYRMPTGGTWLEGGSGQ